MQKNCLIAQKCNYLINYLFYKVQIKKTAKTVKIKLKNMQKYVKIYYKGFIYKTTIL